MNIRSVYNREKEEEKRIKQQAYQALVAQMEKERREYAQKKKNQSQNTAGRKDLHQTNANNLSDMVKEKYSTNVAYKAPDYKANEGKTLSLSDRKEMLKYNHELAAGQYATDESRRYDVLPKKKQNNTYQDMAEIFDGVDLSDQSQRNAAMMRLGKYMGEHGLYYDSSYMKENEQPGMVREREVERGEKDPQYTDSDLQLVTDAYNSLMTGYALGDMVVAMEEEAPYRARGEEEARQAAEASGTYTFEGNPEGAFNAVISETNEHINDLQYELNFGIARRGAAYYWITGQDINQVIADTQKELANEQKYLEVLEKMKEELTDKGYDPNYMMHTYVGGVKGTAEAYIEDEEKKAEELQWVADLILGGEGYEDLIPEEYQGLSYDQILDMKIEQDELVTDLKQRDWQETEGVKRPAIEGRVLIQEDFEEKSKKGASIVPVHDRWEKYPTEKSMVAYINDPEVRESMMTQAINVGDAAPQWEWEQLTEEEKGVIRYLAAEEDYEGIKEYLEGISPDLRARYVEKQNQTFYEEAKENPVGGWMVSTGAGMMQWPGLLYSGGVALSNAITGEERPVDPNSPFFSASRLQESTMAGATADASELEKWLAETGSSLVQSLGIVTVAGPTATVIMASNAAGQASYEASQIEGVSAGDVLLIGMAAGTIEYLTEKVGVDSLLETIGKGSKISGSTIKELLKQGGIEASEELTAEIANQIAQQAILGEDSEYEQYVDELVASGISRDRAQEMANKEFYWNRPIRAAISGFMMGSLSSGVVQVANTVTSGGKSSDTSQNGMMENNGLTPEQRAYQEALGQQGANTQQGGESPEQIAAKAYQDLLEQQRMASSEQGGESPEQIAAKAYQDLLEQQRMASSEAGGESSEQIAAEAYRRLLEEGKRGDEIDPDLLRQREGWEYSGELDPSMLQQNRDGIDSGQTRQESMKARRAPELSENDVNIVLKGELTEAYLKKNGMSLEELSQEVEAANEGLLRGKTGAERQSMLESLMADEVLRNVEEGEVKSPEGRRDFKYLEGKRETSLSRKRLDRRMEAYERKEVEVPRAGDMQRQAPTQEVPEMQPMPNGPMRQENIDRGEVSRYDEIGGSDGEKGTRRDELLDKAENQKLKNAINEIYRQNAKVGDGGLADAVRHELLTKELVGGKSHIQKAKERITNLENIIKKQPLNNQDLELAKQLLEDLQKALGGK